MGLVASDKMVAYRDWIVTAGTTRRLLVLTAALLLAASLGGCTSFSSAVTDAWPTWAGGMPKDVPPRPGAPGYDEFIAHQQQHDETAAAPGATSTVAAPGAAPGAYPPPGAPAPAAYPATTAAVPPSAYPQSARNPNAQPPLPPAYARPDDSSTTRGGLY
jgi:hypothetical protein